MKKRASRFGSWHMKIRQPKEDRYYPAAVSSLTNSSIGRVYEKPDKTNGPEIVTQEKESEYVDHA